MASQIKSLTLIVPCLNEENNISSFMNRVLEIRENSPNINFRVMFVDDGSTDNSRKIIRGLNKEYSAVDFIFLTRNFGSHLALLAGLDSSPTDTAVFIPCDQPNHLSHILKMLQYANEGIEVVIGENINKNRNITSKFFSWFFYYLFNLIGDVKLPSGGSDCFLVTKRPIEFLRKNKEYNTNVFMLLLWPEFKSITLEFENIPRTTTGSKWTFAKRLRLAMDSFFGFSMAPLRFITIAGIFFSTTSFLFLTYTVSNYFFLGTPVPGIPTVVCTIAFGFGCMFLALGIIAEYLSRALDFSRNRPLFIIDEQNINNN